MEEGGREREKEGGEGRKGRGEGRQEWKGGSEDKRERKEWRGREGKAGRKECIPAQLQLPTRPILQCFLAC